MVPISLFEVRDQQRRVLLNQKYIGIQLCEASQKFIQLFLLTQEGKLIEGSVYVQVQIGWVLYQFLKIILFKGECKQSVVKDKIVQPSSLSFCLCMRQFFRQRQLIEHFVPLGLEFLLVHESIVFNADVDSKGRAVPTNSYLLVDFSHSPCELFLFEVGKVEREQPNEDLADLNQLFFKVLAVEFEGVIHDITVVESGNNYRPLVHGQVVLMLYLQIQLKQTSKLLLHNVKELTYHIIKIFSELLRNIICKQISCRRNMADRTGFIIKPSVQGLLC